MVVRQVAVKGTCVWSAAVRASLCAALFISMAVGASCREPTQVEIAIGLAPPLKCTDLRGITIVVGKDGEDAEAKLRSGFVTTRTSCVGDTVGTLVVTPSGGRGAVLVAAAYGASAECKPPAYQGCIVARRQFAFVDHASLRLPIELEISCVDVPCGAVQSCRAGACVSSEVTCRDDRTCTTEPGGTKNAGTDGGPSEEAGSDGGPSGADGGPPPIDGGAGDGGTNLCPRTSGPPTDCALQPDRLCCVTTVETLCASPTSCSQSLGVAVSCAGNKNCPAGQFCCYQGPVQGAVCAVLPCLTSILCSADADCPSMTTCSKPFAVNNNGNFKACQ